MKNPEVEIAEKDALPAWFSKQSINALTKMKQMGKPMVTSVQKGSTNQPTFASQFNDMWKKAMQQLEAGDWVIVNENWTGIIGEVHDDAEMAINLYELAGHPDERFFGHELRLATPVEIAREKAKGHDKTKIG